jgi:hypothetical protein
MFAARRINPLSQRLGSASNIASDAGSREIVELSVVVVCRRWCRFFKTSSTSGMCACKSDVQLRSHA